MKTANTEDQKYRTTDMLRIHVEQDRISDELDELREGMKRHAEQHVPWETYEPLTVVLRDEVNAFCGAALGECGRGWLSVGVMWVQEDHRGNGYGRKLLEAIEALAVERGSRKACLDTFSYQAKPFYEKCGYTVFGSLDDYPPGHTRYFMCKTLTQPPADENQP